MTLEDFLKMTAQYPRSARLVMPDLEPIVWAELGVDELGTEMVIVSDRRKPVTDGESDEE